MRTLTHKQGRIAAFGLAAVAAAVLAGCSGGSTSDGSVTVEGNVRRIRANGIPNHDVGAFPNPGNPNVISAQAYNYAVPVTPSGATSEKVSSS
mgnify:CR=1 FL=1